MHIDDDVLERLPFFQEYIRQECLVMVVSVKMKDALYSLWNIGL